MYRVSREVPEGEAGVTISAHTLEALERDMLLLRSLMDAGVDNWGGWDNAIETYHQYLEGDE